MVLRALPEECRPNAAKESLMTNAQQVFAKVYEQAQQAAGAAGAGPDMGDCLINLIVAHVRAGCNGNMLLFTCSQVLSGYNTTVISNRDNGWCGY